MSTFLKLHGFVNTHTNGSVITTYISWTSRLGDGLSVELPIPFVPIGNGLAVAPAVVPDGDRALRIDLTRWSPAYVSDVVVAMFPVNFNDQGVAVTVARAFDADPTTSWSDTASVRDWLRTRFGLDVPAGGAA